ncbi:MAG: tetratricopeptide repeat protein [Hyphomicrobiales bacterium]
MKRNLTARLVFLFLFICTFSNQVISQRTNDYKQLLGQYIGEVYDAGSTEELELTIEMLHKLSEDNKKQWLPMYYQAYGYIRLALYVSNREEGRAFLKRAQSLIDKAMDLSSNNSELYTLTGLIFASSIRFYQEKKAQDFIEMALVAYNYAIKLNPKNPRPWFLKGQILSDDYGTKERDLSAGCKFIKKAAELYNNVQVKDDLLPQWGSSSNAGYLKLCEDKNKR